MADKTQRIMWTVLPNGFDEGGGRLRLSVLVGPELTLTPAVSPAELSQFPDLLDWPARLASASFQLELAGNVHDLVLVSAPDTDVWRAMFPDTTYVRPREFEDMRGATVLSYPALGLHDQIEAFYSRLAFEEAEERPQVDLLSRRTRHLTKGLPTPREVLSILRDNGGTSLRATNEGAFALHDAYHFPLEKQETAVYAKQNDQDPREDASWRTHRQVALPNAGDFREEIDFHRIVSSMNEHRTLLRLLGLVLDFEMDRPVPLGSAENARLLVTWVPSDVAETGVETLADLTPFTRTILTDGRFDAAPQVNGSLFAGPLLPLGDERFRLIQVDLDGSAIKFRNFARSMSTTHRRAIETDDEGERGGAQAGAPALRSGGIALIEAGRGDRLAAAFERSGVLHDGDVASTDIVLFAEDLVRGIHVDILDETVGSWRSLCRRDADYELLNTGGILADQDQEGMVRLGGVASADDENADIVKLAETTLAWTGWSLTAPPVGRGIDTDDEVRDLDNTAAPDLPLETRLAVRPGSLPSLRFGRDYRMRARVADLALNALRPSEAQLDEQGALETSERETYKRFEPIESPAVALVQSGGTVETPGSGESMGRIAIRTFNATPDLNDEPTVQTARRHVVAPKVTAKLCETHGMLDGPDGRVDPTTFPLVSSRDGEMAKLILTAPDSGTPVPDPDDAEANRSKPRYSYAAEVFNLDWLPDPLADGVLVRVRGVGLPADQETQTVPYYPEGAWPDALPFQIVLIEQGNVASVKFVPEDRQLLVSLPKAEEVRIRLSHHPVDGALDVFGIWDWMTRRFGPQVSPALEAAASAGRHWMLTPDRELRLYHAVQKPLVQPEFLALTANRSLGETSAIVSGRTPIHAKSTEKIDLRGTWVEARDRPSADAPRALPAEGDAGDQRLLRSTAPSDIFSFNFQHEFGDTRYRRLSYRITATTRYREFMPEAIRSDATQLSVVSEPGIAWIPNTAPPPAPEIVQIVPTFGWSRAVNTQGRFRSFRDGGGVRVYLRRPWMVSGAAEMLAVVLPPANASVADIEGALKPYVTQWGGDPVFGPVRPQTPAPTRGVFPLAQTAGPLASGTLDPLLPDEENDLRPGPFRLDAMPAPGLPAGQSVSVAPHAVGWDAERGLWYADIVVDPGSVYMPFLRVALARYQAISRDGAHLSPIALADFVQLTPDRLATISPRGAGRYQVSVFGIGYAQSGAAPGSVLSGSPEFEVKVQRPAGDAPDELGWVDVLESRFELGRRVTTSDAVVTRPSLLSGDRLVATVLDDIGDAREELRAEAEALVERRDFATLLSREDLIAVLSPPLLWQVTVTLPPTPALSRFRLLICEYEVWDVDAETPNPMHGGGDPTRRLVYAEAWEPPTSGGTLPIDG